MARAEGGEDGSSWDVGASGQPARRGRAGALPGNELAAGLQQGQQPLRGRAMGVARVQKHHRLEEPLPVRGLPRRDHLRAARPLAAEYLGPFVGAAAEGHHRLQPGPHTAALPRHGGGEGGQQLGFADRPTLSPGGSLLFGGGTEAQAEHRGRGILHRCRGDAALRALLLHGTAFRWRSRAAVAEFCPFPLQSSLPLTLLAEASVCLHQYPLPVFHVGPWGAPSPFCHVPGAGGGGDPAGGLPGAPLLQRVHAVVEMLQDGHVAARCHHRLHLTCCLY
mmetsp:Transcript_38536/g.108958  ORF Transcript_38536/g.108958 Transcript_38536/m.108958 type:complete len:278 (+) Transcript_38536:566-1399(+)